MKNTTWLPTCHSTNTYVHEWLKNNDLQSEWLVYTFNQTNGRGQAGDSWESEPGKNLTFTKAYKLPLLSPKDQFFLNMAISLGIVRFLSEMGIVAQIKWPNDIYVGRKKIAGILIENQLRGGQFRYSAVGVGLNVNQESFQTEKAISMCTILGQQFDLLTSLEKLCNSLDEQISRLQAEQMLIREEYSEKLFQKEVKASYRSTIGSVLFEGTIKGVDEDGKLDIATNLGLVKFGFKEVDFLI